MELIKTYNGIDHYNMKNGPKGLSLRELLEQLNEEVDSCNESEREELLNQEVFINMTTSDGNVYYGPCTALIGWTIGDEFLLLGNVYKNLTN
jgi:hypothetical protein